jgi:hypothetical protein
VAFSSPCASACSAKPVGLAFRKADSEPPKRSGTFRSNRIKSNRIDQEVAH